MKIFFQSFGCAKNSADSENLIGLLSSAGHDVALDNVEKADFAIINTCGFIEDAVRENVGAVLELEELKKSGGIGGIIVVGCLFNRYGGDLQKEFSEVDFFAKSEDWISVLRFLGSSEAKFSKRGLIGNKWSRYLKIIEGCDSFCTYCTIPMIRGRARSVPLEKILDEAQSLCEQGAREICLIGQDPTLYGVDLYKTNKFAELLAEMEKSTPDGVWLRLLYLHPNRVTREFIDMVSASRKIIPYLDVPIQHIDEKILDAMNRSGSSAHIRDIFSYAREQNPFFALRTTLMAGFPGETEPQFQRLLDFLEEAELDRAGAFKYSPEEGTKAAVFPNQVLQKIKNKRHDRLMKLQAKISEKRQKKFVGHELQILIEEIDKGAKMAWGRSYRDAPEVDGLVEVRLTTKNLKKIKLGEFTNVKISEAAEHDLFGEVVE